ncbi:VOC family protein [Galactobacter valiniphilus]|uniref:VOC family protein n=1 Tax=Galactobacter valiniphilus TaxID=2676122 RepID=A0A399J6J5_9MICC|nr:VOC family protein [Galactobacter valiniphilus]RII41093.1 VOC family protein [Galactobacter valiniphilus]
MKIRMLSVFVDDQRRALEFYTNVLGFQVKHNIPVGEDLWLTVVSPDEPDAAELLLEPAGHPAVKPYRDALRADGIPLAQFNVEDLGAEVARLKGLGVVFTMEVTDVGEALVAVLDDTCGNLIQLLQDKPAANTESPGAD